jgi:hypothetical protein
MIYGDTGFLQFAGSMYFHRPNYGPEAVPISEKHAIRLFHQFHGVYKTVNLR